MCVEDDRMPKAIFRGTIDEQKMEERPRRRSQQDLEDDLRRMGVGDCRWRLEEDRCFWRRLVEEAKAHRAL